MALALARTYFITKNIPRLDNTNLVSEALSVSPSLSTSLPLFLRLSLFPSLIISLPLPLSLVDLLAEFFVLEQVAVAVDFFRLLEVGDAEPEVEPEAVVVHVRVDVDAPAVVEEHRVLEVRALLGRLEEQEALDARSRGRVDGVVPDLGAENPVEQRERLRADRAAVLPTLVQAELPVPREREELQLPADAVLERGHLDLLRSVLDAHRNIADLDDSVLNGRDALRTADEAYCQDQQAG